MGRQPLRLLAFLFLALLVAGAGRSPSLRDEMKFGVEAARQGLWREAVFRWEKYLKEHPDNAHLRNNLAVAYESLGDFQRARQEYDQARRLDPDSKEIRDNARSFLEIEQLLESRRVPLEPEGAAAETPAPAVPPTDAETPAPAGTPEAPPAATPPAPGAETGAPDCGR
jgi:tetratricopeptide (TPR) repeat protein